MAAIEKLWVLRNCAFVRSQRALVQLVTGGAIHFNMFENIDDATLVAYDASAYVLLMEDSLKFKEKFRR